MITKERILSTTRWIADRLPNESRDLAEFYVQCNLNAFYAQTEQIIIDGVNLASNQREKESGRIPEPGTVLKSEKVLKLTEKISEIEADGMSEVLSLMRHSMREETQKMTLSSVINFWERRLDDKETSRLISETAKLRLAYFQAKLDEL